MADMFGPESDHIRAHFWAQYCLMPMSACEQHIASHSRHLAYQACAERTSSCKPANVKFAMRSPRGSDA